ncbi:MAG TPA: MFS transporter, partial [Mycobacteriales bacterium]|nr:MFS transporter [Mycobacteriales bacterium]
AAALVLPRLRRWLSLDALIAVAFLVYAGALVGLAVTRSWELAVAVLALAGGAWMTVLSSLNASAQAVLPGWVRARALSYYLVVFMGGQAAGGVLWGVVADEVGVGGALAIAAALVGVATVAARWFPLIDVTQIDPTPSAHWRAPLMDGVDPDAGPVLVILEYRVAPGEEEQFAAAMSVVSRSRRRTGAHRWGLFRDPTDPGRFVETFTVPTWGEHARQHEVRLTVFDQRAEEAAHRHLTEPPVVHHLITADVPLPAASPAPRP